MTERAKPSHAEFTMCAGGDHFVYEAVDAVALGLWQAINDRGRALLAVPGGTTPGPVFDGLSDAALDWSKVTVTLTDERLVDASSPDSNERLVRQRLLRGAAAAARFVPLDEAQLAALPLPLDVVLLGMGPDGHIASLFPGSPALKHALETDDLCVEVPAGDGAPPPQPRRTLSLKTIGAARRRILLVKGDEKSRVMTAAMKSHDPLTYPVAALFDWPLHVIVC